MGSPALPARISKGYPWMRTELAAGTEFSPPATAGIETAAEDWGCEPFTAQVSPLRSAKACPPAGFPVCTSFSYRLKSLVSCCPEIWLACCWAPVRSPAWIDCPRLLNSAACVELENGPELFGP